MRKPRDFDAVLKTLSDKTKALKESKRRQLGELIVATGADALDVETLVGGLLAMIRTGDTAQKDAWRKQGAVFFRKTSSAKERTPSNPKSDTASHDGQTSPSNPTRQA